MLNDDFLLTIKAIKLSNVILSTLEKIDENDTSLAGMPEGPAYMALSSMINLDEFHAIINGLKSIKAIKVSGNYITKGKNFDVIYGNYKKLEQRYDEIRKGIKQ